MPEYRTPGVYIEETKPGKLSITALSTDVAAFVGVAAKGPTKTVLVTSFAQFVDTFGEDLAPEDLDATVRHHWETAPDGGRWWQLRLAVYGFFMSGGRMLYVQRVVAGAGGLTPADFVEAIGHLATLEDASVCAAPGIWAPAVHAALVAHCKRQKTCFAILDPQPGLDIDALIALAGGIDSSYAALYHPEVLIADPLGGAPIALAPSGLMAGIYALTDTTQGVFKAPANQPIRAIVGLTAAIDDAQQERLNPAGVNVLRTFPGRGPLVWGARTLAPQSVCRYINVRRQLIHLEQSIARGLQWVAFEPNGGSLWAVVRQVVNDFLHAHWSLGALQGSRAEEAYFVRCDRSTMSQDDIESGRVRCVVGVALVRPAEFILIKVEQMLLSVL